MPITRAQLESILKRGYGPKLAMVGLDATTADGTNADLNDPIADAIGSLGLAVADPTNVTDADLAAVADAARLQQLRDVARLRTLELVLSRMDQPDQMADINNQQWFGKFYDSLEKSVVGMRKIVLTQYNIGAGVLSTGKVTLSI